MNTNRNALLAAMLATLYATSAAAEGVKATDATPKPADPATPVATLDDRMEEAASAGEERITDAKFFERAASANMLEVELGGIAQDKGTTAEIKAFGARMVTDHSKKIEELESLAASKNVTLPTALLPQDRATCDRLAALAGAQFDEAYADFMVQAHRDMERLLAKTAEQTTDAEIRAFAQETRKGVLDHYVHAQKLDADRVVLGDGMDDDFEDDD
ncbi:MAG TPA: DUF4142 domain-containing protein [Candidatus Saccharimonadia bacterium]|nr:DUF4142 domain-containing protein [Candidatus Saccharimonadia bacterium]